MVRSLDFFIQVKNNFGSGGIMVAVEAIAQRDGIGVV